jgi:mono/diheme cytochrome c family protein
MKSLAGVLIWAAVLAGCGSRRTPPIQVFSDMKQQPKYLPQSQSGFFRDGRELRRAVPGTVARGFLKEDDVFYTGKRDGAYAANPLPLNGETLGRGQERFNIYCAPCHDQTGSGQGIVSQRASWIATNLTDPRIEHMADGEIFDTVTHGKRSMPAYRFQISERDRWAIVTYVRALQRAANGTIVDVPSELRSDLR